MRGKSASIRSCKGILRKRNPIQEREGQTGIHMWLKALRVAEEKTPQNRNRLRRTSRVLT